MQILDEGVVVNVECSLWTGKSRLTRDDLDPAVVSQLPPEALASLGSLTLCDPALLKPVIAVKSKLFRQLDVRGAKFLSGWIISAKAVKEIEALLQTLANEYDNVVQDFILGYEQHTREWMDKFPQWAPIIALALPDRAKLRGKFRFFYQMFHIQPVPSSARSNNLGAVVSTLGDSALEELSAMLRRLRDETFKPDRERYTKRAFNGFGDVFTKIHAVSFLHPSVEALRITLEDMVKIYSSKTDDLASMRAVGNMLEALADPSAIDRICGQYANGQQNIQDVMLPFLAVSAPAQAEPAVDQPDPQDDAHTDEPPVAPAARQMATLMARLAGVV